MATSSTTTTTPNLPFHQTPIIILGAGIIGCATAHQLLTAGFAVTLVAEHLPSDISPTKKPSIFYASAWAGAAWHAGTGLSTEHKVLQTRSFRHLARVAGPADGGDGDEKAESGVCHVTCREYVESPIPSTAEEADKTAFWGRHVCPSFRELDKSKNEYPAEFATAWTYDCLVTDPTIHMPYLGRKIVAMGGTFVRRKVSSLKELYEELYPEPSVFINASGLGSLTLDDVQDSKCFPERGQNVFYRPGPEEKHKLRTMYFRNGKEYTYIIPRPLSGGLVLGGVKQRGNVSPEIDMDVARDEIVRAHRLAPESVPPPEELEEKSLSFLVGIRPSRDGGFRLERERVEVKKNRAVHIFHAYGFAGNGYQYSYGVGDELVKWVEEVEKERLGSR